MLQIIPFDENPVNLTTLVFTDSYFITHKCQFVEHCLGLSLLHLFLLIRQGIIQPCRVGEDGKPQPVEHILQLTENIKLKDEDKD